MARDTSSLSGKESTTSQFPVAFVYLDIPDATVAAHNSDIPLWVDRTNDLLAVTATDGYDLFYPYPGLRIPQVNSADNPILSEISLTFSNVNEAWFAIIAENQYRDAQVDLWRGNLDLTIGDAPDSVTAVGVVKMYTGRIDVITANYKTATVHVVPHITPYTMQVPYVAYRVDEYPTMPSPGTVLKWGYTEKTL